MLVKWARVGRLLSLRSGAAISICYQILQRESHPYDIVAQLILGFQFYIYSYVNSVKR